MATEIQSNSDIKRYTLNMNEIKALAKERFSSMEKLSIAADISYSHLRSANSKPQKRFKPCTASRLAEALGVEVNAIAIETCFQRRKTDSRNQKNRKQI